MIRLFPFIFILLWSSAFITTKPIVDYSDPFAALGFRFLIVAIGFYFFSLFLKQKVLVHSKNILPSISTGILFHGFYLGGVFYSISLLPPFWQKLSLINPILYIVNCFRFGFIGITDIPIVSSLSILCLFNILLFTINFRLLNRGYGIKS